MAEGTLLQGGKYRIEKQLSREKQLRKVIWLYAMNVARG